jgi:hypothetical protein
MYEDEVIYRATLPDFDPATQDAFLKDSSGGRMIAAVWRGRINCAVAGIFGTQQFLVPNIDGPESIKRRRPNPRVPNHDHVGSIWVNSACCSALPPGLGVDG